jgi:hypothetical protein
MCPIHCCCVDIVVTALVSLYCLVLCLTFSSASRPPPPSSSVAQSFQLSHSISVLPSFLPSCLPSFLHPLLTLLAHLHPLPHCYYPYHTTPHTGKIGCTQPRRVAAMSVAARVATEMNVKLGELRWMCCALCDSVILLTTRSALTDSLLVFVCVSLSLSLSLSLSQSLSLTLTLFSYLFDRIPFPSGTFSNCLCHSDLSPVSSLSLIIPFPRVSGQDVGYSIRFEDCTSECTVIKYMTGTALHCTATHRSTLHFALKRGVGWRKEKAPASAVMFSSG